jgi:predicted Zn-dependent peptidase
MIYKTLKLAGICMALLLLVTTGLQAQDAETIDKIKKGFPDLNEINVPDVEKVTLDNGMRIYLLEDRSLPLFNANVRVNCGGYLEPAEQVGLTDMMGGLLRTGGTTKWSGDEIDEILEGIGGTVETYMDVTSGGAYVNVLSEYTDLGLEVLAEVLRNPIFDEDKIELSKVEQRTGISRRNDDIATIARREFVKKIYGAESPYARHTEYKTIDAVTRDDMVAFHKQWFHPEAIQLSVWGDFDKDEMLAKIKQYFDDWTPGNVTVPPLPEVTYDWRSKVFYVPKTDVSQAYVRVGHLGGMVSDDDYADRIVMNSILGGGFGSRVTDNVRTKMGLAYSTGGRYISNYSHPGYFFMLASTEPGNTVKAAREIIKQIKSMHTDLPTAVEMGKGKDGYLNSFVFNFDSRREVIGRIMDYDFYGLPEDFLEQEKKGVENVTPEAVMQAAIRNIKPDQMIVIVAGNGAEFDEPLENLGLGPVDTIDITIPSGEVPQELAITPENLEKGNALLGQAVEAAGGLAAFQNVKSIETVGKITIFMQGQAIPGQEESLRELPKRSRSVMKLMGMEMFQIRDGAQGWKTDQATMGIVPMTEDDIVSDDESDARDLLTICRAYGDPYYRAVFDGTGSIDGVVIDWVALIDDEDEVICRLGIDCQSHSILCSKYWGEGMMGEGNIQHNYSQFSEVSGLQLPAQKSTSMNGEQVKLLDIAKQTINGEVPAGAFTQP